MELHEFETSLVYRFSSRTAMVTQKNLVLGNKKKINKPANKHINKKKKTKRKKVDVV